MARRSSVAAEEFDIAAQIDALAATLIQFRATPPNAPE
jgi:hypothetical protein